MDPAESGVRQLNHNVLMWTTDDGPQTTDDRVTIKWTTDHRLLDKKAIQF